MYIDIHKYFTPLNIFTALASLSFSVTLGIAAYQNIRDRKEMSRIKIYADLEKYLPRNIRLEDYLKEISSPAPINHQTSNRVRLIHNPGDSTLN